MIHCSINLIFIMSFIIDCSETAAKTCLEITSRYVFYHPFHCLPTKDANAHSLQDLDRVGRDLREVIIIDNSPTSYMFHPQHAIPISSWFSDIHDNELLDLIPVLEDLAVSDVKDVRLVLDVKL